MQWHTGQFIVMHLRCDYKIDAGLKFEAIRVKTTDFAALRVSMVGSVSGTQRGGARADWPPHWGGTPISPPRQRGGTRFDPSTEGGDTDFPPTEGGKSLSPPSVGGNFPPAAGPPQVRG